MIKKLLQVAVDKKASDLHLGTNTFPRCRINGTFTSVDDVLPITESTEMDTFAKALTSPEQYCRFLEQGEVDFSYSLIDNSGVLNRFRINLYKSMDMTNLAIRLLPKRVPTINQLGHPEIVKKLARLHRGLIIVSGQTGSGKTTTLASMIDLINKERYCHIVTLEDPIEYVHTPALSVIHQREVHTDTSSFYSGLRAALRQDTNVILVGEMRDNETIATAISAAETGHLVFASLHTGNAPQTIDRIIDGFPANQQQQIRMQLSLTLEGVICQQLVPKSDGSGRVAALEIMVATRNIRSIIRDSQNHMLAAAIEDGRRYGMFNMESNLKELYQRGIIKKEELDSRQTGYSVWGE